MRRLGNGRVDFSKSGDRKPERRGSTTTRPRRNSPKKIAGRPRSASRRFAARRISKRPTRYEPAPVQQFRIEVWVDTAKLAETEEGEEVVIEAPQRPSITVGVLATASAHFALVDTPFKPLLIERDAKSSEHVPLRTSGNPSGRAPERPESPSCSSTTVERRVASGAPGSGIRSRIRPLRSARPSRLRRRFLSTSTPNEPHLSVYVTAPTRDGSHFMCAVATPLLPGLQEPGPAEEWVLPDAERVADFVSGRLQAMLAKDTPAARRRELLSTGHKFWEVAPKPFKEILGRLIAAGAAVEHIYIASEEPTMPWELIVPSFPDETGLPADRDPLGVEFAIGRWTRGDSSSPPQRVQVSDSVVIAPTYAHKPLDATQELDFLSEHLAGSKVEDATIDSLDAYFRTHSASVVHFVCHGAADVEDDDAIYLDDNEELSAGVARTLDGFKALCRARRPLIFINSCEVGRLVPSLGGVAGFPKTFAELGARAIIAPIWPVRDVIASEVAVDLYRRALDEPDRTLAEIVRDIRARAFEADPFEDSYAAYCFYGDPMSPLERLPG